MKAKYNYGQLTAKQYKELEKNNLWVTDVRHGPGNEKKPYVGIIKPKIRLFCKWTKFKKVSPFNKAGVGKATFQKSMKLTLFLGQCLGLNPVLGILSNNGSSLRFNYISWRMLYSIIICLGQGLATSVYIYSLFKFGITYSLIVKLSYYGSSFFTTVLFLRIATQWPTLVQEIEASELVAPLIDPRLRFRIDMAAITVFMLSVLDYIIRLVACFTEISDCYPEKIRVDIYRAFIESSYPYLLKHIWFPYSLPLGILLQLMSFISTFNRNYSDLFIICVSFYLTSRIEQVNAKLKAANEKYLPASVWRKLHKEYNEATRLVRKFDEVISGVVFTVFVSKLFFVCLQLYNILRHGIRRGILITECPNFPNGPIGGVVQAVYFLFSLVFLMLKTLNVSLIAARVHSASLEPATTLYAVPSNVYCTEVQRFLDQTHGDNVALTGLRFFHVTKELALTVAGTIVTYELVLLQFDSSS